MRTTFNAYSAGVLGSTSGDTSEMNDGAGLWKLAEAFGTRGIGTEENPGPMM